MTFSEISNVSVLCEREFKTGGMDSRAFLRLAFLSRFSEENIFYTALFAEKENSFFNDDIVKQYKNILIDILPDEKKYENVIKVIEPDNMRIISNLDSNQVICYEF